MKQKGETNKMAINPFSVKSKLVECQKEEKKDGILPMQMRQVKCVASLFFLHYLTYCCILGLQHHAVILHGLADILHTKNNK